MKKLTFKYVMATNNVFGKMNNLRRWTDFSSQQKYNELAKQAYNCIVAYMIAKKAENEGHTIHYEFFPKIALHRAFEKVYVFYDTPEHKIDEICGMSTVNREEFKKTTIDIISEKTDADFANFITQDIGEYELRIYKAATKIATYIEFLEQQRNLMDLGFYARSQRIQRIIEEYKDIPGVLEFSEVRSPVFRVLQEISNLRNQNRWATFYYNVECSVLGHLFDTAVFAYLFALDESKFNEEYATKMFFFGLFHDVAETWTKDIPSPIKDRINGFREATEVYEKSMLEKHLYSVVPPYLSKALRDVMFENEENKMYKKRIKEADYISADSECCRNFRSGSRDIDFVIAICKRKINSDATDLYKEVYQYFSKIALEIARGGIIEIPEQIPGKIAAQIAGQI